VSASAPEVTSMQVFESIGEAVEISTPDILVCLEVCLYRGGVSYFKGCGQLSARGKGSRFS
jgi:hypothetical protein